MAGIKRIVTLDDADRNVLNFDPKKLQTRVTALLGDHIKAAKTALDKLRNSETVTPDDVQSAKTALQFLTFWLSVLPKDYDLDGASDIPKSVAATEALLGTLDKLLAERT